MLDVAAITSGRHVPSTRFRVRQHIEPLRRHGVRVREFCPAINKWAILPGKPRGLSNRAVLPAYAVWQAAKLATRLPAVLGSYARDVTWLSKEILPGYPTIERAFRGPIVVDVDDAIWLTPPFGPSAARRLARSAAVLIVGNAYLADWFADYARRVCVIPTAIDASSVRPRGTPPEGDAPFVVGWMGSRGNLPYLHALEDALATFLSACPHARLLVVSDRPPHLPRLPEARVEYERWRADREASALGRMSVGLMPLEDTPWARGKCSFKMLQYMAAGLPVVVSPVGMNREVLALGEVGFAAEAPDAWTDALRCLYERPELGPALGRVGRAVVLEHFERRKISARIAEVFRSV